MTHVSIEAASSELSEALMHGRYQQETGWVACAADADSVSFFQPNQPRPSMFYVWFKAIRPISLTATFMPAMSTLLLGCVLGYGLDFPVAVPSIIAMLLLQVSVNLFNDVADYVRFIDLPDTLGGGGMIQQGWLTAQQVWLGAWGSLVLAAVLAIPAMMKAPEYVLVCAVLSGLGVIGYSGKPFQFKYRGLGDVAVFLLCGPVLTFGVAVVAFEVITWQVWALGVFFGLLSCTILNGNNINDIKVDRARDAKTLAGVLGFAQARWLQIFYYLGALSVLMILVWDISPWLLLVLFGAALVVAQIRTLFTVSECDDERLAELRFDAAKTHLLMSLLLCIALVVVLVLP